jgi:hypothetical protein
MLITQNTKHVSAALIGSLRFLYKQYFHCTRFRFVQLDKTSDKSIPSLHFGGVLYGKFRESANRCALRIYVTAYEPLNGF